MTTTAFSQRRWVGASLVLFLGQASLGLLVASEGNSVKSSRSIDNNDHNNQLEPHPDPNEENHDGMVYIGKVDSETGHRIGFDHDNGIRYIFGTGFDDSHKFIEEKDLHYHPLTPVHDLPQGERDEFLQKRRHGDVKATGGVPKPFGHVETHALDGGITPPKVVHVDPFFIDKTLVTNKEFGKFVRATYYQTEAEKFGWSFSLISFIDPSTTDVEEVDPEAPFWVAVPGAYWRRPEGPHSTYKYREDHPVVHVTHRDAAEYCKWVGKRLPGEWEWEAAARAGNYGPKNRTLYAWGDDDSIATAIQHVNLWGGATFPHDNDAADGWRATNPVKHYPPNSYGIHDMTGNVWEWQRGGKHKARIVRGGSFVDSLDGSVNHAATLGARSTLHGTTSTANVGFRCAKAPKRRVEHHYVYHDEQTHGTLAVEDKFGKRDIIPQKGWEDQVGIYDDEDEEENELEDWDYDTDDLAPRRQKRKVIKPRERYSNEL
jgi:formylglycine-generating enzyme